MKKQQQKLSPEGKEKSLRTWKIEYMGYGQTTLASLNYEKSSKT